MRGWLLIVLTTVSCSVLQAQTLISEMGPVTYFNSLDTTKSPALDKIARRCYCFLQYLDSSGSVHLKLDIDAPADTTYYQLKYDNLYANYFSYTDSTRPPEKLYSDAGVYIKARDTVLNETHVLQLLVYGIEHLSELQKKGGEADEPSDSIFVPGLFAQKLSLEIKQLMRYCK